MTAARRAGLGQWEPDQRRRRYWGMIALLALIVSAFGVMASLSAGISRKEISSFQVVPRKPFVQAYSPIALALDGLPPNSTKVTVSVATPQVRAISVSVHNIDLYIAGKEVRSIYMASPVKSIQRLAKLVDNPAWITEAASGQITLWSALTINPGVKLLVGGPRIHLVRMASIPSVFIGTSGGTLDFNRVTVEAVPPTNPKAIYYKPFVMATGNAVMNVTSSTLKGLGWDWNASYGASWEDGSTGTVIGSVFEGGFIGTYVGDSRDLLFRNDVFRGNALYGLDPHSYSSHLHIDHVVAEYNHAHGIIFSDHVTDSVVEASLSRDNGENGIMMDRFSTHNRILHNNVLDNAGDGLVTSRSPYNVFDGNAVIANRIGVRVSVTDARRTTLTGNQVDQNALAEQNVVLSRGNETSSNGGQWDQPVLFRIWIAVLSAILIIAVLLEIVPRLRARHSYEAAVAT